MFSKNNIEITIGQKVLILEVPIVGQHKLVELKKEYLNNVTN